MTVVESAIVVDMLYTCENPPEVEVEVELAGNVVAVPGEDKPETEAGVWVLRGGGSSRGNKGAGEPRRRRGVPEGDGPRAPETGMGTGWCVNDKDHTNPWLCTIDRP